MLLHPKVGAAVLDKHVILAERALVQKKVDALACGQLALRDDWVLVFLILTKRKDIHADAGHQCDPCLHRAEQPDVWQQVA